MKSVDQVPRGRLAFCLIVGAGLLAVPESMATPWRTVVRDALRPGQIVATSWQKRLTEYGVAWNPRAQERERELRQLRQRAVRAEAQARTLAARNIELAERLRRPTSAISASLSAQSSTRLVVPELVEAAVLGDELASRWRRGTLLDKGTNQGVGESSWVLSGERTLLDLGEEDDLHPADQVLLGHAVLGKVEKVGRWTSTMIPLTDPAFRGRAQIVRATSQGPAYGAEGLLVGTGDGLCRLENVEVTESVQVGDELYTADRDGLLPTPLYFGRVVKAQLKPEAKAWQIVVEPACRDAALEQVQVLRLRMNPRRMLPQSGDDLARQVAGDPTSLVAARPQ